MLANPKTKNACQESWRKIALKTTGNPAFHVCHAGLCYLRSPINMNNQKVAWMVTGQFYITPHNSEKSKEAIKQVIQMNGLNQDEVEKLALEIPVLKHGQQEQVQLWAPKVADTVQSMLCERSDLVNRLEKIAEISTIRSSLKQNTEKGD
jgi:hypothetical protein